MADNKLSFKIKAGLKNIIGRDLITDDYVAVFELVKNSFDAYAKRVTITFKNDKIIITDDGKGMDIDDINDKWLAVAYSAKKEGLEDEDLNNNEFDSYRDKIQEKKFFAGAKGIGRFSCDRLGNRLILTSRKASSNSKIEQIEVNWADFEIDSQEEFVDIKVLHRTLLPNTNKLKSFSHGVILEISELNSSWDRQKKLELKYSLEKLINPFEDNPLNGFSIFIKDAEELKNDSPSIDKRTDVNGEVKNFVFETLELKTTQILTKIDALGDYITTSLWDRGTLIYKIRRTNNTNPKLENISINLFHLNRAAKTNFTRLMGIHTVNFGSIFLYKNGFRVPPYGDYGFDYFGLDSRKAQKHFDRFGSRDLIGRIEINGNNQNFKEISSRDGGLVRNSHYDALVKLLINSALPKLEVYAKEVLFTNKDDKNKEDLSALNNIIAKSALLNLISEEIEDDESELLDTDKENLSLRARELLQTASDKDFRALKIIAEKLGDKSFSKEAEKSSLDHAKILELQKRVAEKENERLRIEQEKKKLEEQLDLEKEKNTFLRATSRGLNDDAKGLVHNIKLTTKNIRSSIENLFTKVKSGNYKEKDIFEKLQIIKFNNEKILKIAKIITRANFKTDENSQVLDVVKYIEQYVEIYNDIFDKSELIIKCNINNSSFIKRLSALDIALIFDDLISNSQKAGAKNVILDFDSSSSNELRIIISDDGDGVCSRFLENQNAMFELGVSEGTIDGSGIGLHSVRTTLKPMQAEIRFIGNNQVLKGASFEITIRK